MKTAVLIPCYNEELTIEKVIKDFKKELPDADIYVYDNNSKDKTAQIAKANGVNVYHYLTYLLEKLPDDRMSDDELELLAPWNETVKAEIEHRANESNQSYVNCQGAPATEK